MKNRLRPLNGFTLVEALISLSLATVFLGSMLSIWIFSSKNFKEESLLTGNRYSLEKALERLKQDVRLTDGSKMLYYPSAAPYSAISMPAATKNGAGFYTMSSNAISWTKTIIYHVYQSGSTYELRRSVFNSFSSSSATRQTQLNSVVGSGGDPSATTETLFSGSAVSLEMVPGSPSFDGYNSSLDKSTLTSFGSAVITPGNHNLRLQVSGKNTASSGYKMGFDQFVAAPSGENAQEAEVLPVSASSGGSNTLEDMSSYTAYGSWDGNYQAEFQSTGVGNYVQYQIYNDQWIESNFENMTHASTEVSGTDPAVKVASRENQSLSPAWQAAAQTTATEDDNPSSVSGTTIRNILSSGSVVRSGQLVRFKFRAATTGNLQIIRAYFGPRQAGTYNFTAGGANQLYFNNGTVAEGGTDAVGAVGASGSAGIDIPAGEHAWTNWIEVPVAFPATTDYLISFSVHNGVAKGNETYWDPSGVGSTASYSESGDTADATWLPADVGLTSDDTIHAVEIMSAWQSSGVAESQIYDTKMTNPAYAEISWSTNGSGTYALKVRSSSDSQMTGAADWSTLSSYSSSPAALGGSGNRYVQFQATLTAASPYTTYPSLDNVQIRWPGQTTLVEFSGVYTKRPSYGMFQVLLDGSALTNALDVTLSGTSTYQGRDYDTAVSTSIRAKNTGK